MAMATPAGEAFGIRITMLGSGVAMSYEILVGLHVVDDAKYSAYRLAMRPILSQYQGQFGYDFKIAEVLIPAENSDINRVFTINFFSKKHMENFFSDAAYLAVKDKYFSASVASVTMISSYEKNS
jgi:uncharacterized protein (DUF1330 family)